MTDATTHTHSEGVEGGLRARIRALGPDAIAEIARRAKGCAPQAKVREFRDGLTLLSIPATLAIAAAVDDIEAAHAAEGNVVRFQPKGGDNVRKARVKKAKAPTAAEAVSATPEAIVAPQVDDRPPAAAIAPEAVSEAHKATVASEMADIAPEGAELDGSILPTINGEFAGEIVAGAFGPFNAGRVGGGSCVLRLEMRDGSPFDVRLKFLTSGPPHIVLRDARALAAWVEAVGAPPTAGFTALGENLWIAGCGKRVLFDLRTHEDHRGLPEVVIVNVRVERTTHA